MPALVEAPATPAIGPNGKPAAVIDPAVLAAEEVRRQAEEEARRAAEKALADAKAELERRAADLTATRTVLNKAVEDADKAGADLRRLAEQIRTSGEAVQPTDAKLLLEALEALQQAKPKALESTRGAQIFAALVALADSLSRARQPEPVYRQARLAVWAIAAGHLEVADAIVKALRQEVSNNAPAYLVLKGAVVSFFILVGLGLAGFALHLWIFNRTTAEPLSLEASASVAWMAVSSNIVVVSAIFGLLGSLVSVLLRLSDFDGSRRSRQFLLFTGGVLPVVGAIFAMVVCAIFASQIVGTSLVTEPAQATTANVYFYMVAGFVAGFSERFARGLVGVFEGKATPKDNDDKSKQKQPA